MFLPHYLPYNEAAKLLTYEIARELHLSLSGKTGQKHEIIIASSLYAVKHRDENTIVWRTGKDNQDSDYWAFIPNVGHSVSLKICTALEDAGFISRVTDEGRINLMASQELDPLMKVEMLSWLNRGKRTPAALFEVNTDLLDIEALAAASFVETNRPHVYLNKAEKPTTCSGFW